MVADGRRAWVRTSEAVDSSRTNSINFVKVRFGNQMLGPVGFDFIFGHSNFFSKKESKMKYANNNVRIVRMTSFQ